ncbi:hypothetical protein R0135_10075 [Congregibacter variabilis]|uniref:Uncharacterized protein n=1 Tax=Congregibacter variabilis TaxID=3081200 RepID=A0ABZ0I0H5_9GAMM|nr:hypothetical protein R0135_10075 [Congregibacter sp. IMCC43200]
MTGSKLYRVAVVLAAVSTPALAEPVKIEFLGTQPEPKEAFARDAIVKQEVLDVFFEGSEPTPGTYRMNGSFVYETDTIGQSFALNIFQGLTEYQVKVNDIIFNGIGIGSIDFKVLSDADGEYVQVTSRINNVDCPVSIGDKCPVYLWHQMRIDDYNDTAQVKLDIQAGTFPDIVSILSEGFVRGGAVSVGYPDYDTTDSWGPGQIVSPVGSSLAIPATPEFSCEGFYGPAASEIVVRKPNRVIPLRMNVFNGSMEVTEGPAPILQVTYVSSSTATSEAVDVEFAGKGSDGNQFVYADGEWAFNLKTKGLASGSYGLSVASATEGYVIEPSCVTTLIVQ